MYTFRTVVFIKEFHPCPFFQELGHLGSFSSPDMNNKGAGDNFLLDSMNLSNTLFQEESDPVSKE